MNVISEYHAIERGDIDTAVSGLEDKYKLRIQELNKRLKDMTIILNNVNNMMEGLLELCGGLHSATVPESVTHF